MPSLPFPICVASMNTPAPAPEDCCVYPPNKSAAYAGAIVWFVFGAFAFSAGFFDKAPTLQDLGIRWLLSPCFLAIATFKFAEMYFGLPVLTLTREGIAIKTPFRTKRARWSSLGSFKLRPAGRRTYQAVADVLDSSANRSLFWKFNIADQFTLGIEALVIELNARRAQALGESDARAAPQNSSGTVRG